jgi:hypothetical protein
MVNEERWWLDWWAMFWWNGLCCELGNGGICRETWKLKYTKGSVTGLGLDSRGRYFSNG